MSSYLSRIILISCLLLAIAGCGGSSGSSDSSSENNVAPTPDIATVSLDQAFVQSAEDKVLSVSGKFVRPDSLSVSQSPDIGLSVVSFQENQISLRAPGVDRPSPTDLELTFVYGEKSVVKTMSFLVQNTSAESVARQVRDTLEERESILELTQDFSLYRFFIDYAYLYDLLTYSEKKQQLAAFSAQAPASRVASPRFPRRPIAA